MSMPLHVIARGAGEPALVFLHHFGGSARAWDAVADRLAGGHRCLLVDLPGFGLSPPLGARAGAFSVAAAAHEVAAAILACGVGRYLLVGHSMGGKVALVLAGRRPTELRALVLVAPSPPSPEPMSDVERAALLAAAGDPSAARETAGRIAARPIGEEALATLARAAETADPAAWRWWLERGSREDVAELAAAIAVPTLVVAGSEDKSLGPTVQEREVVRRVAGARLAVVPGAGHLVPLEAPGAVADLVAAELTAAAARSGPRLHGRVG